MKKHWALPLGLSALVFLAGMVAIGVLGSRNDWGDGGSPWMMGWGFGWMWIMPVFMLVFWGLVLWAVVAVVQGLSRADGSRTSNPDGDSPLEILKRRYARGEISKEEYEEKKRDLV